MSPFFNNHRKNYFKNLYTQQIGKKMNRTPHQTLKLSLRGAHKPLIATCVAILLLAMIGNNADASDKAAKEASLKVAWNVFLEEETPHVVKTIKTTSDNGFLIAGYTEKLGKNVSKSRDPYIAKFDSNHKMLWEKTIEAERYGEVFDFILDKNDGAILAGEEVAEGKSDTDATVTRIDAQGNIVWKKYFGDNWNDGARSIIPTDDDGAIIAGFTTHNRPESRNPPSRGKTLLYVVRIDKDGNKVWDKTLEGKGLLRIHMARSMTSTVDGGALIVGGVANSQKIYSVKIDSQGTVVWRKKYDQPIFDSPNDPFKGKLQLVNPVAVVSNPKGGSYVLGNRRYKLFVMKLDDKGEQVWRKNVSNLEDIGGVEAAQSMVIDKDGNLIILGFKEISHKTKVEYNKTDTYYHGQTQLLSVDSDGNKLWDKTYKYGKRTKEGYGSVSLSSDGGFYVARGMFNKVKEDKTKNRWNIRLMEVKAE